jgi:hypothetical protein
MAARAGAADDHARGERDGLRLALAILAAEEAKWSALLGESTSWTALNRLSPKGGGSIDAELAAALDSVGL